MSAFSSSPSKLRSLWPSNLMSLSRPRYRADAAATYAVTCDVHARAVNSSASSSSLYGRPIPRRLPEVTHRGVRHTLRRSVIAAFSSLARLISLARGRRPALFYRPPDW